MPHYAVIALDHPPHSMPLRDRHRQEHRRYVLRNDAGMLMTGAITDEAGNQAGSIYVFDAGSEAEVRRWLAEEPFCQAGVYASVNVVPWTPALNRFPHIEWPEQLRREILGE